MVNMVEMISYAALSGNTFLLNKDILYFLYLHNWHEHHNYNV